MPNPEQLPDIEVTLTIYDNVTTPDGFLAGELSVIEVDADPDNNVPDAFSLVAAKDEESREAAEEANERFAKLQEARVRAALLVRGYTKEQIDRAFDRSRYTIVVTQFRSTI